MTTYTKNLALIEEKKNEIVCPCPIPNYKPKNMYILPGGGVSAFLYAFGVYKALHTAGLLVLENGDLNKDNVFVGSSGGTFPGLLIMYCIALGLSKEPNWFEKYVEATIEKIKPLSVIDFYLSTQVRSFLTEQLANCFLDDWLYTHIQSIVEQLMPKEFIGKQGINFLTSDLNNYFKFNYVTVKNGNMPYMTDNHKDTSFMTTTEQFKSIFGSCCTVNGLSYTRFFQNHDAAGLVSNYINCISSYLDNKYIRNLFYYTTISYDEFSYKSVNYKNTLNLSVRDSLEANYFLIHNIKQECLKINKNFCLINPPNKFNTAQKFGVPLYNDLQQRIYYEVDFSAMTERFLGNYFFHNGPDMRKVVSLFGYYESLFVLRELNEFNLKKQDILKNVDYDFLNSLEFSRENDIYKVYEATNTIKTSSLFRLNPEEIIIIVSLIKFSDEKYDGKSMIESCFKNYCGCREKSAAILTEYLTLMQGYYASDYTEILEEYKNNKTEEEIKYQELYPITTTKQFEKVCKKPQKYLNKEYKRVSKDIVNIYFPSFKEKLKNIIPFK